MVVITKLGKTETKTLFEYIEIYYNQVCRHSTNGWVSPEQYEK
jgi:putative transposase